MNARKMKILVVIAVISTCTAYGKWQSIRMVYNTYRFYINLGVDLYMQVSHMIHPLHKLLAQILVIYTTEKYHLPLNLDQ